MIYIKFTDAPDTIVQATAIERIGDTKVSLTFPDTVPTDSNGFTFSIYKSGLPVCGDYSAYKTIYRTVGKIVTYSNDKSVYVVVTGITLDKSTLSVTVGATGQLTATVSPTTATEPYVMWSSSDTSIATVDYTGKITGVKAGTVTITATCGGFSATCTVTVAAVE